jgi:hypothetical protein
MNYCSKCGNKLEQNTNYCSKCGNPVFNNSVPQKQNNKINNPALYYSMLIPSAGIILFFFIGVFGMNIDIVNDNWMIFALLFLTGLVCNIIGLIKCNKRLFFIITLVGYLGVIFLIIGIIFIQWFCAMTCELLW